MAGIRAFVGHSFTANDEQVVGQFLKYLNQVSGLLDFSWQHAENAEPKDLAAKVLSLIADKTVFIAICTRKELVAVQPKSSILARQHLLVP